MTNGTEYKKPGNTTSHLYQSQELKIFPDAPTAVHAVGKLGDCFFLVPGLFASAANHSFRKQQLYSAITCPSIIHNQIKESSVLCLDTSLADLASIM